jgi:DtxR family Mn-dependent transcriptional regulator
LLADVIGLDWAFVHEEACRWEHVMSEQVELRILELLGSPTESPYGNPIPGLEHLGGSAADAFLDGVISLTHAAAAGVRSGTIRRLAEPVQVDPDLLHQLHEAGVLPGAEARIRPEPNGYVSVEIVGHAEGIDLPAEIAQHIYVAE